VPDRDAGRAPTFDGFPKDEVYLARGTVPPQERSTPLQGLKLPPQTHKFELLEQVPHAIFKGGREWRVDSSRFPISRTITGVVLDLEAGDLRELRWHPNADKWQYVIEGKVSVTMFGPHGRYRAENLSKGDVGYLPQGYGHSIENVGDQPCRADLRPPAIRDLARPVPILATISRRRRVQLRHPCDAAGRRVDLC
jgi:oxalate decarboxylase